MNNRLRTDKIFTMDDLALELGLSKSTVSRALSGSGRISAATVQRVKDCAERNGFRPNLVAKALAGQKTLNLAAVMPQESTASMMLFYHECLSGMTVRAAKEGYNILVCMLDSENTDPLEDVVHNRKVDAVILTQLKHDDKNVALLAQENFPFVVIGSGAGKDIAQVDSKMTESCAAFSAQCVSKLSAGDNVLFVCGSLDVEANNNRLSGFLSAMENARFEGIQYAICTDVADVENDLTVKDWKLILCSDDVVCLRVMESLKRLGVQIGTNVLLASLHDSILLESSVPSVSALRVNAFTLGEKAADVALNMLGGNSYEEMNYVDCSFEMRESTGRER
ncbi:MAG: LacI family DNA-binding transcriptional regulator [Treponema sp.]|nr:LacI family DNA-binding transcriptional regulator [Treponema sp.]